MFGRKNKGKDKDSGRDRKKGGGAGGNMAAMMGLGGMDDFDLDDDALEAELLELEGKPRGGKKGSKDSGRKKLTMDEIQKLAADSSKDIDLDVDGDDDFDEDELLAELEGEEEEAMEEGVSAVSHDIRAPPQPSASAKAPVAQPQPPVAQPRQPIVQPKPPIVQSRQPTVQPKPPVAQPQQPIVQPRAPPPTVPKPKPAAPPPSSTAPPLTEQELVRAVLKERYAQYLEVSKKARAAGNETGYKKNAVMAARFLKVIKGFDAGNPVDLSQMPPPPQGYTSIHSLDATMIHNLAASTQQQQSQTESQSQPTAPEKSVSEPSPPEEDNESNVDPSIPIPKSPQEALEQRLTKYQSGVETAKKEGNSGKARRMGRIVKQYEDALKALKAGKTVDFNELPVPPGYPPIPVGGASKPHPQAAPVQAPAPAVLAAKPKEPVAMAMVQGHENSGPGEDEVEVDPSIPQPQTPLEALHQRLDKYRSGVESAKAEGNGSKARRMGRIVSQYEDAIKAVKAGKQVDFLELPTPPGFPPIPVGVAPRPTRAAPSGVPTPPKVTRNAQQQLALLQQRCSEYTSAAVRHRDAGDREEALRLLKYVKDLKAYIDLSKQGIPVDETAIPPPLHELGGGTVSPPKLTSAPSKHVKASEGDEDTFQLIEDQIQKQIDFCEENAVVYEKCGNRPGASRFRNMAEDCKQELLTIKGIHGQGLAPPRFTVEMRTVSLLHGFPDLGSTECEVEVIRLVDAPKDQTVYVEIEFPYPTDDTPKDQTQKTKDEVNPQLNSSHKFSIDRKHKRAMTRAYSRGVKLTLWQHKALWKDTALGTATFKCEDLETKAEVKGVISFYDGRKEMSQKVEVAVRLREPLSGPDVEEKQIKWLVFSEQIVKKSSVAMPKAQMEKDRSATAAPSQTALAGPVKLEESFSLSALRVEYQLAQGNPELQEQIKKKLQAVQQKLQSDRTFAPNYKKAVEASIAKETKMYQQYSKAGKQKEAKVLMERVKAMQAEYRKL